MERSVRHHARKIQVPSLADPEIVQAGALSYDAMCSPCHGAPGASLPEMAQGFDPQPPALAEEVKEWTPAELFWITKHGIKLTGMPAWGPTHNDQELWEIVAFLEKLPTLSPADYQALTRPTKPTEGVMKREEPHERRHRNRHSGVMEGERQRTRIR